MPAKFWLPYHIYFLRANISGNIRHRSFHARGTKWSTRHQFDPLEKIDTTLNCRANVSAGVANPRISLIQCRIPTRTFLIRQSICADMLSKLLGRLECANIVVEYL